MSYVATVGIGTPLADLLRQWESPYIQNPAQELARMNLLARIAGTLENPDLVARAQARGGTFTQVGVSFGSLAAARAAVANPGAFLQGPRVPVVVDPIAARAADPVGYADIIAGKASAPSPRVPGAFVLLALGAVAFLLLRRS